MFKYIVLVDRLRQTKQTDRQTLSVSAWSTLPFLLQHTTYQRHQLTPSQHVLILCNAVWNHGPCTPVLLYRILGQFNSIYQSVPLDERLCQEFFKFSRGGSLTPQFMMDTSLLTCERLKRVKKALVICYSLALKRLHTFRNRQWPCIRTLEVSITVSKRLLLLREWVKPMPWWCYHWKPYHPAWTSLGERIHRNEWLVHMLIYKWLPLFFVRFMYGPLDDGIMHMLLAVGELKKLSCSDVTIGDDVAGPPPSPSLTNDMKEYKVYHVAINISFLKFPVFASSGDEPNYCSCR